MNAQPASVLPESDLVDMAIAGSAPAFGELSERYRDKLRKHLYFRLGNRDDADDLTQQVFLHAWRALPRFRRTESPFLAWLMTIAHNLLVDRLRAAKGRSVSTVRLSCCDDGGNDDRVDALALLRDEDRWADPEAVCAYREDVAWLHRALGELDAGRLDRLGRRQERAPCREAVEGRYLRGEGYDVLARRLGIGESNARVRVWRGLRELRMAMAAAS